MKTALMCGTGLALMMSGTALASFWMNTSVHELGDIGPLDSLPNGGAPVTITITEPANGQLIKGWAIEFDYKEYPDSISWASDIQMTITSPDGSVFTVGGLSSARDCDWDFQGSVSDDPGHYADTIDEPGNNFPWKNKLQSKGEWTLTFLNDWKSKSASTLCMNNVVFTFFKIPTPGSLALLGLAGLVARPSRRR
jgi:hypothetical protein